MKRSAFLAGLFVVAMSLVCHAAESVLKDGDFVAVGGDSITEQKLYSVFIEDYLLMCRPKQNLRAAQFGWGGEAAPGFLARMENEVLRFSPTVATTCYGMNDGGYGPINEAVASRYREAQREIVEKFKKAGVRVVLGSPGCVDSMLFRKDAKAAAEYNKTLAALRDIDRDLAKELDVAFADVYSPMFEVMAKAKAKYGERYPVAGVDGVHPNRNGHLVMAYAFLKAMGCDGEIGTITVDLGKSEANAGDGHKIVSVKDGAVEVESARYPFCFYGDPTMAVATKGIIEFFPFNQDLNRFQLIVNNAGGAKMKVTWGEKSKEFSAEQLAKGINLAAEFLDNPFSEPFARVEDAIQKQQEFEAPLVKSLLHSIGAAPAEQKESLEKKAADEMKKEKELLERAAAEVKPVKHVIRIEAVK